MSPRNLCIAFFLAAASIALVSAGDCGTEDITIPQLRITYASLTYSGTDDRMYGRVLSSPKARGASSWSNWARLYDSDCDNHDNGATNYFDDFVNTTDPWIAVALYMCGTDGVGISSVGFWDGATSDNSIDYFCSNVAGPSNECAFEATTGEVGVCSSAFLDSYPYGTFWMDQDQTDCPGMAFRTTSVTTSGQLVAFPFVASDPGVPDCSADEKRDQEQLNHEVQGSWSEKKMNNGMVVVSMVAMASAALGYVCYRKCQSVQYKQLSEVESLL